MSKAMVHKIIINNCLKVICKLIAQFYSYSIYQKTKHVKTKAYTYWLSSELKYIGKNSFLRYPINLLGGKYISIGESTGIGARGIVTAWDSCNGDFFTPIISIGSNCLIGEDCHITAINKIYIGNNILMGKKITITDNSHGKCEYDLLGIAPKLRPLYSKGPVIIEDNVWIGDKATILPGVRIGKNAIIGANSVVTKDVGENCVVGGNPGKILKIMTKAI